MTVTNSTFRGNYAGGLVNGGVNSALVRNTILADNTGYNCNGSIASLGHNLDSGNTCGLAAAGDQPNTNPLLGPLAYNGGPTPTYALLPGSPAINAGSNTGCPVTDQRGVRRLGMCNIGAFEFVLHAYLPTVRR